MSDEIRLRPGSRPPQIGDVIGWAGDGWEAQPVIARPQGETYVHTNTIVRVAMGETRSPNFVAGSAGWCIYPDGSAEFNDIVARGTIYADAGEIGGWTIQAAYLAKDTGTDATSAGLAPSDYPFYAGATYAHRATAPFRVTPAGALVATSATITGTITATAGTIGGWAISATQIKADSDTVILDKTGVITVGGAGYLTSSPFTSGVQGWRITPTEAEFGNIVARGEIRTAVFKYGEIHAQAGQLLVTSNAAKLEGDLTIGASGAFNVGEAGRFGVNDIVRLKDGTGDVWLTVLSDDGDGWYDYTRSSGSVAGTVFRCGTAVVGYGVSGEGGVVLDATTANGPFVDIFTHAGAPWTTMTTKVRLGNLAGISDPVLSPTGYGLYTDNAYLSGELVAGGGEIKLLSTGMYVNLGTSTPGPAIIQFEDFGGTYDFTTRWWTYVTGSAFSTYIDHQAATGTYTDAYLLIQARPKGGSVYYAARLQLQTGANESGLYGYAGGDVLVGTNKAGGTGWLPYIKWYASGDIHCRLQDSAGANKFSIRDSGNDEVAAIDSDGKVSVTTALGCRVYRSTIQTIPNDTGTALSFDTELYDTDACFAATDTKLYAKHAGYYVAGGGATFYASAAGASLRSVFVQLNGEKYLAGNELAMSENSRVVVSVATGMFYMAANDYIEIRVYQDTGGNLNVYAATATSQYLNNGWLVRVV